MEGSRDPTGELSDNEVLDAMQVTRLFQTASSSQEGIAEVIEHFSVLLSAFPPLYIILIFRKSSMSGRSSSTC